MTEQEWRDLELYFDEIKRRLKDGDQEYGGESFSANPLELMGETIEEAVDIPAWLFILWVRLKRMEAAMLATKARAEKVLRPKSEWRSCTCDEWNQDHAVIGFRFCPWCGKPALEVE